MISKGIQLVYGVDGLHKTGAIRRALKSAGICPPATAIFRPLRTDFLRVRIDGVDHIVEERASSFVIYPRISETAFNTDAGREIPK